ncbi:MAG: hypothetical protein ACRDPM_27685 [Solirubrobacteraceae bacterium]
MSSERDRPAASMHIGRRDLAGWLVMMVGAAFVPGLAIALCVLVIVTIGHLVS